MDRSRTPGNTDTAMFDVEIETGRWRSHPTTPRTVLEAGSAPEPEHAPAAPPGGQTGALRKHGWLIGFVRVEEFRQFTEKEL